MSEPADATNDSFLTFLYGLEGRKERGALAALRRGLSAEPGSDMEMYRYLGPYLPNDLYGWRYNRYFLVASLFALHPKKMAPGLGQHERNFGASFGGLRKKVAENDSTEKRFVALLNADQGALPNHLRQAVGLLKANDVPVHWAQLLNDLQWWDSDKRWVQQNWARAFWGRSADQEIKDSLHTTTSDAG